MNTYERLSRLSAERLADTSVYWPIDHVRDLTVESLGERSAYLTGGYVPLPRGENLTYTDRNRHLLKEAGVQAVRYTLIAFGYFDSEQTMRALPMYASLDSRQERDYIGSYHNAIWEDYYNQRLNNEGEGGFRTAGGADTLAGEMIVKADEDKLISYLRVSRGEHLSTAHIDALAEVSERFPIAKYVITTRGFSQFMEFNDGNVTEVEY